MAATVFEPSQFAAEVNTPREGNFASVQVTLKNLNSNSSFFYFFSWWFHLELLLSAKLTQDRLELR